MSLVDTNVILRFLVGDVPSLQREARALFKEAESGKRKLQIKVLVVAEACFVLESFYKKDRAEIARTFQIFLAQKWLSVDDRSALLALWPYYVEGMHFVDSYLLALHTLNSTPVFTFDKKLKRMVAEK